MISVIILCPPYWLISSAKNNAVIAPTISDFQERYKTSTLPETRPTEAIIASQSDIKEYLLLKTAEYGEIFEVLKCESGINQNANNGDCIGIAQFTLPTWLENCSNIDERKNPYKSIDCMIKLWNKGEQWRWDCWCKNNRDNLICKKRGF